MHATPPVFEKARAYINLQLARTPGAVGTRPPSPALPFVTISREAGSGGSSLAHLLAARLNETLPATEGQAPWTVFDQETVQQMLSTQDLPADLARFLPEDRVSEFSASVGEIIGLHPNLWDLVQRTNAFLSAAAQRGRAILVGRGAHLATAAVAGGTHVRLVAPETHRIRRLAHIKQCSTHDAATHTRHLDTARRSYVRSVFDGDVSDPVAYDLVINTARVTLDQAASQVASLVLARSPAPARAEAI